MNNYKTKEVMKKLASLLTCICLILSTTACSQSKNYSSGNWSSKKVIASNKYVTKDIKVDNCGFNIPDAFVVGYGLDYNQRYRNLPYIGVVEFEEENS